MDKSDLKKLKSKLPRKYRAEISKRSGYSLSAIDQVLRGDFYNEEIIRCAVDLGEACQSEKQKLEDRIRAM